MARSRSYAVEVLKAHPVVTSIVVGLAASAILNHRMSEADFRIDRSLKS